MPSKFELSEDFQGQATLAIGPKTAREDDHIYPYIATPGLVEAVNLAILLQRPLLLKGEPGTGKSQLAKAVAWELARHHADGDLAKTAATWKQYFEFWPIKSTTNAADGRYTIDHIRRLRDTHLIGHENVDQTSTADPADVRSYIQEGVLWKAFQAKHPVVVLVDEIDKADIDFPNDLLLELDEKRFTVQELSEAHKDREIQAHNDAMPLILIT
ncbi:MAG: MoxR family ATPase, partial [Bacteroidota bacterium]